MELTTNNKTLTAEEALTMSNIRSKSMSRRFETGSNSGASSASKNNSSFVSGPAERRFLLRLPQPVVTRLLLRGYQVAVERRGRVFRPVEGMRETMDEVANALTAPGEHFGFMLAGGVGRGKTTILRAVQIVLNTLEYTGHIAAGTGMRLVEAKKICNDDAHRADYRSLFDEPLLAIDDFGAEPVETVNYGSVSTPVIDLLEFRYDHCLFTAISTNLTPAERKQRYGDRIYDRCKEMCRNIVFRNNSLR